MKNIHLIPTDKPTRLHFDRGLFIIPKPRALNGIIEGKNIYITSDEEIGIDDYYLVKDTNILCLATKVNYNGKKIILTTDPELIVNGVQAIDDKFLEWFVKNPTCEYVEVTQNLTKQCDCFNVYPKCEDPTNKTIERFCYGNNEIPSHYYKIIIPQEQPKQEWKPKGGEEVWIKVFSNWSLGKYIGYDVDKEVHLVREPKESGGTLFSSKLILPYSDMPNESKQKTLEEAARNHAENTPDKDPVRVLSFIEGAKWQGERYDEGEVFDLLTNCLLATGKKIKAEMKNIGTNDAYIEYSGSDLNKWFEENKKK